MQYIDGGDKSKLGILVHRCSWVLNEGGTILDVTKTGFDLCASQGSTNNQTGSDMQDIR
jgi:hypothetical protein